ncbi:MAG TPA: hypothetical protein DIW37_11150 [Chryseobacterium sp.]|nr:hypothetical protein [Chryseobacterium sp.]
MEVISYKKLFFVIGCEECDKKLKELSFFVKVDEQEKPDEKQVEKIFRKKNLKPPDRCPYCKKSSRLIRLVTTGELVVSVEEIK